MCDGHTVRRDARKSWLDWVRDVRADIVVLSTGAHIYPMREFGRVLEEVRNQSRLLEGISLIWKTQQPAGCAAEPLSKMPDAHFWASTRANTAEPSRRFCERTEGCYNNSRGVLFNWPEFASRDEVATSVLTRPSSSGSRPLRLLDLQPLFLRTDAHIGSQLVEGGCRDPCVPDCLHLCMPGPLHSLVPRLLLHLLLTEEV